MLIHNMTCGERFVSSTASVLEHHGIGITLGYDFDEYRKLMGEARPDHCVGAPFDPDLHDLNDKNAFWMIGQNRHGEIMHTQTLRTLDIGQRTVGDYFLDQFRDFPPPGVPIDMQRSQYRVGPGANRMKGQVAYHGEFWIGGEPGEYRGSGLSSILSRLGFWEALQRWDLDHIVAFMAQAVAFKGLVERAGWMHTDPGALQWYLKEKDTPIDGFMAYLHREDIHFLLDLPEEQKFSKAA
jgi:hypothetical protein